MISAFLRERDTVPVISSPEDDGCDSGGRGSVELHDVRQTEYFHYLMKRTLSFLIVSVFFSVSFASTAHSHASSPVETKNDCALCLFVQTPAGDSLTGSIPEAPPPLLQEVAVQPAVVACGSFHVVLPDSRAPPFASRASLARLDSNSKRQVLVLRITKQSAAT